MKRLKRSTRLNLRLTGLFILTLFYGWTVKNFLGLALTPNQPVINTIAFNIITGFYAVLTLFSLKLMWKIIRYRIYKRKQGCLEDPVPSDHGATPAEVIKNLRNEQVEFVAYFLPSGEKLAEATMNNPVTTDLTREQYQLIRKYPGCISVHNHPGPDIVAFSPADVKISLELRESRAIVVAEDICFMLDFPDDTEIRPKEVTHYMCDLPEGHFTAQVGAGKQFFEYLKSGLLDELSVMRCVATANKFGFDFDIKPTDEMIAAE